MTVTQTCRLCGQLASLRVKTYPGYQEPQCFGIFQCRSCVASFAVPLEPNEALYERIYAHIEDVPGYSRYAYYAQAVLRVDRPLQFLADAEDMYWAVAQVVDGGGAHALGKALEIGSGLGYLTYALRSAGVKIEGLDVSRRAVAQAAERYGDFYHCSDLAAYVSRRPNSYDTIIMLETIEHVRDPAALLNDAMQLLRPGGRLLLSTPNRSFYPPAAIWETDAPPVHLWWFSERSIAALAERSGGKVQLQDFSAYTIEHPALNRPDRFNRAWRRKPVFNASGRLLHKEPVLKRFVRHAGLLRQVRLAASPFRNVRKRFRGDAQQSQRRETLFAIVVKVKE